MHRSSLFIKAKVGSKMQRNESLSRHSFAESRSRLSPVSLSELLQMPTQEKQLIAAGVKFAHDFFIQSVGDARQLLPKLQHDHKGVPKSTLIAMHVLGLHDALLVRQLGEPGQRDRFIRLEESGEFWLNRLEHMQIDGVSLDSYEEQLCAQAAGWKDKHIREVVEDLYAFSSGLTSGESEAMRNIAGLKREGKAKGTRYARRIGRIAGVLPYTTLPDSMPIVERPWREVDDLSDDQRDAAEMFYTMSLFDAFRKRVKVKDASPDEKISRSEHLAGLVDAYKARSISDSAIDAMNFETTSLRGSDSYTLWDEAGEIMSDLEKKKDLIFSEAVMWSEQDITLRKKVVRKYMRKLPEDQQTLMYELTGMTPESKGALLRRWSATLGLNVATDYLETALVGTASYFVSRNMPVDVNVLLLALFTGRSYISFGRAVNSNLKANYRALEDEGLSTRAPSKLGYDIMKSVSAKPLMHKLGAAAGYIAPEVIFEIYAVASLITNKSVTEFLEFLLAANYGGSIYERLAAYMTNQALTINSKIHSKRSERRRTLEQGDLAPHQESVSYGTPTLIFTPEMSEADSAQ